MTIKSLHNDISRLRKALKLVEETENALHFEKSSIMLVLCEQINVLEDKKDKQIKFLKSVTNS